MKKKKRYFPYFVKVFYCMPHLAQLTLWLTEHCMVRSLNAVREVFRCLHTEPDYVAWTWKIRMETMQKAFHSEGWCCQPFVDI